MGVDLIVTGSAVFDGGDAGANLRQMQAATRPAGVA
jgi:pentose-5-phosphate-3-epimerase